MANTPISIVVQVSIGELYDKYSILEIKQQKIQDKNKLCHVLNEMEALKPYIQMFPLSEDLQARLKQVNLDLWEIEDAIRLREASQTFDSEFIELARSVYKKNDERFRIKNIINQITQSAICEVKSYA